MAPRSMRRALAWLVVPWRRALTTMILKSLTSNNSKHSLSAPGTPADNAVIEHYWGDFKYIWMAHHSHPQTLTELKDLVRQGVEYFNKVEISSKRNNLTAEDFRNEAV